MMSGAIPDPAHKNGDTAARDLLPQLRELIIGS